MNEDHAFNSVLTFQIYLQNAWMNKEIHVLGTGGGGLTS